MTTRRSPTRRTPAPRATASRAAPSRAAAPRGTAPRAAAPRGAFWMPDRDHFMAAHAPGRTVAVRLELPDPGWDPAALASALPRRGTAYLLETAGGPPDLERRTVLAWDPESEFVLRGPDLATWRRGRHVHTERCADPLATLRAVLQDEGAAPALHADAFSGGLIGYFAYDFKNRLERLPDTVRDDLGVPEFRLGLVRRVLVWDRNAGVLSVRTANRCTTDAARDWQRACRETLELWRQVRAAAAEVSSRAPRPPRAPRNAAAARLAPEPRSNITRPEYDRMLARCREHILAGDIYQANLSHRFRMAFPAPGGDLYRGLRAVNPSPFAAYLRFPDQELVSCSPERLVKLAHGRLETRPIAGTRPRAADPVRDAAYHRELLASEKERAEHLMIVDMARNDIGRVCEAGSVQVERFMQVEAYSHVWHLVSNVTGSLAAGRDAFDVLAAVFPGASITGVPKVRCMQIVDELEPVRRGVYTGSAGYIGFDGAMDFNILIRTVLLQDGAAYFHVGGGIVADSIPEREYQETLAKGRAMHEALQSVAAAAAAAAPVRAVPREAAPMRRTAPRRRAS